MTTTYLGKVIISGAQPEWLLNVRGPLIRDLVIAKYHVICIGSEANEHVENGLASLGAEYRVVQVKRNQISLIGDISYCYSIYKLCRDLRPDFFFSYTVKPIVFGSVAASMAGVTSIFALVTGLGSVFTGVSLRNRIIRPIVSFLYSIAFARCSRVFFQNPDDKHELSEILPEYKSTVVDGSGVDIAEFLPSKPTLNPVTFLLIARLIADKGIREYAIAAREIKKQFPSVRFLLVGPEDPSAASISRDEIAEFESGSGIEYLGSLKDVRSVLRECSVYVLPSYREGTPRTVLEALACGRGVITTDTPGCRETVIHEHNGFLIPAKDPYSLQWAMRRFIESPELIRSMGEKSRRYAEDRYDVRLVNRQIIDEIASARAAGVHG